MGEKEPREEIRERNEVAENLRIRDIGVEDNTTIHRVLRFSKTQIPTRISPSPRRPRVLPTWILHVRRLLRRNNRGRQRSRIWLKRERSRSRLQVQIFDLGVSSRPFVQEENVQEVTEEMNVIRVSTMIVVVVVRGNETPKDPKRQGL